MACHCTTTDFDCNEGRACPVRYGFPSSRRYPRTLAEAFPDERRQWAEPHVKPPLLKRVALFFKRWSA